MSLLPLQGPEKLPNFVTWRRNPHRVCGRLQAAGSLKSCPIDEGLLRSFWGSHGCMHIRQCKERMSLGLIFIARWWLHQEENIELANFLGENLNFGRRAEENQVDATRPLEFLIWEPFPTHFTLKHLFFLQYRHATKTYDTRSLRDFRHLLSCNWSLSFAAIAE